MSDWGMTVRLARTERGWTQQQLSEASGVTQPHISEIESGKVSPGTATIDRLMAALGAAVGHVPHRRPVEPNYGGHGVGLLSELDILAMLADDAPPVDWVIEGVAARGAVTMLAGKEGAGKSFLTQALAVGVASGRKVAGLRCARGRAWIIDAENGEPLIWRRFHEFGIKPTAAGRLRVWDAVGFDLDRNRSQLDAMLADAGDDRPALLVLDGWKSLWSGSEHNSIAVGTVLNGLRFVAKRHDVAIVLIHHTTKEGDTYRGSGAIGATIEAVFTFKRSPLDDEVRELTCRKMRLGVEPPRVYLTLAADGVHDHEDPAVILRREADERDTATAAKAADE